MWPSTYEPILLLRMAQSFSRILAFKIFDDGKWAARLTAETGFVLFLLLNDIDDP